MNIKVLSVLSLLVMVFSCKKNQETVEPTTIKPNDSLEIKAKDISKIKYTDYILDTRVEEKITHWNYYKELHEVVNNVKKADLTYFKNNDKEIRELLINLKQSIPLEVNSASVMARITALETKLLKLESLSNLDTTSKTELLTTIKEFLVAFSNFNLQMNKKIENDNIIIEKP
ncbi:hypothetical protein ACGK9U_00640 [Mariniflexile sp. HNIBRBA6329]|uniref:hypothetical protein n=1 Tax=Mariniflexile sp. HNIBRBA6329 TaxID=3373088 RepID=UPI0037463D11